MPTFKEMYDTDVSPTLIYRVTNAVIEQVVEWQTKPLNGLAVKRGLTTGKKKAANNFRSF